MDKKYKQFIKKIKNTVTNKSVYSTGYSVLRGWLIVVTTSFFVAVIFVFVGFYIFFFLNPNSVESDMQKSDKKFDVKLLEETLSSYKERESVFEKTVNDGFVVPDINNTKEAVVDMQNEEKDEATFDKDEKIELSP
jgi:hypothetical protein